MNGVEKMELFHYDFEEKDGDLKRRSVGWRRWVSCVKRVDQIYDGKGVRAVVLYRAMLLSLVD